MSRARWWGAVALASALTACGGAGSGSPTNVAAHSTAPKPLSQAQLRANLLTPADVPTGWVRSTTAANAPAAAFDVCKEYVPVPTPVSAGYQPKPGQAPDVGEWLLSYPTHGYAQRVVASIRVAADKCRSFGTGGHRLRVGLLPEPRIGDDSFAFRLISPGGFIDVEICDVATTVMTLAIVSDGQAVSMGHLTGLLARRATASLSTGVPA